MSIKIVCHSLNLHGKSTLLTQYGTMFFNTAGSLDIFCFQETGHVGDEILMQERQQGRVFFAASKTENRNRSVAIAIGKGWIVVSPPLIGGDGGLLGLRLRYKTLELLVVSVYMPHGLDRMDSEGRDSSSAAGKRRRLALEEHQCLDEWREGNPLRIYSGDYNETLNWKLDRKTPSQQQRRVGVGFLPKFLHKTHMVDVWRYLNPGKPGYTWSRGDSQAARLDYHLVSHGLWQRCTSQSCKITPTSSDHQRLTIELNINCP